MFDYSQEWLCRRIVEESRDAVIFADGQGVIRLWNLGAQEMFGYTVAEALGQSLDLIIPETLRGRHHEGYRRVMATGATRYAQDLLAVPGLRKDGARLSLEFTIVLVRADDGEILGTAALIRDVTARWQKDKALRARLAALEARTAGGTPQPAGPASET